MGELVEVVFPYIVAVMIAMVRILAALFLVPLFSLKVIKGLPRYAVAIAIAMPVSVTLITTVEDRNLGLILLGFVMLKEAMIGFIIGFLLAVPFWIFQSVGVMIDNQRGALAGGYFNPGAGPDSSMLSDFLSRALVIVLITTGMLPMMFSVLIESYILWPPLEWMPTLIDTGYEFLIKVVSSLIYQYVLYSGPIILILLLIDTAFAILGTYSPQLQVYFLSMPAKSLVALFVLVLYGDTLWYLGGEELMNYLNVTDALIYIFEPTENPLK